MEKCSGAGDCLRAACFLVEGDSLGPSSTGRYLCYFHAACLVPSSGNTNPASFKPKLTVLQINTAKQQAKPFKTMAEDVWDNLVLELRDAEEEYQKQQRKKTPPIPTSTTSYESPNAPPSAPSSKRQKESFFALMQRRQDEPITEPLLLNSGGGTPCPSEVCSQCQTIGQISYVCISSAISAPKSDTWGNSSRPDRVLRYTCANCHHTWLVEEG